MDQPQNPAPQIIQTDQNTQNGFSLTFQLIITTILVILGFWIVFFLTSLSIPHCSTCGFALVGLVIWDVIIGIPLIILSIILAIIAHNKLKSNPSLSKTIANIYLAAPIVISILFIPALLSNFQNYTFLIIFSPLLIYDWIFYMIFVEAKKSIKGKDGQNNLGRFRLLFQMMLINCQALALETPILVLAFFLSPFFGIELIYGLIPFIFITSLFYIVLAIFADNRTLENFILKVKVFFALAFALGWIAFLLAGPAWCDGCGTGNIFNFLSWAYILLIPYTIIMFKFGFPKLRSKEESLFESKSDGSPTSTQISPLTEVSASDPRFPTFDTQPKPTNNPPDSQKQS